MAYELKNTQKHNIAFIVGPPVGTINIRPGDYVPTLEMEVRGVRAEDFSELTSSSFLSPVPELERREILAKQESFLKEDETVPTIETTADEVQHETEEPKKRRAKKKSKTSKSKGKDDPKSGGDEREGGTEDTGTTGDVVDHSVPEPAADLLARVRSVKEEITTEELAEINAQSASSYKGPRQEEI